MKYRIKEHLNGSGTVEYSTDGHLWITLEAFRTYDEAFSRVKTLIERKFEDKAYKYHYFDSENECDAANDE